MNYQFTLKDKNAKGYRTFVWFLFCLHIAAGAFMVLTATDKNEQLAIYILFGFYVVITALYFIFRKRKKAFETFSLTLALLYANFWLTNVGVIAVIIFGAIFLFVNIVQNTKTRLLVTDKGVQYTRMFKTINYAWADVENMVSKDGLLTLDLKSNKLIQSEFESGVVEIDENEFNHFCKTKL